MQTTFVDVGALERINKIQEHLARSWKGICTKSTGKPGK